MQQSDFMMGFLEHKRMMLKMIKDHGWAAVGIFDDPDWPSYTYSVGIWKTARRPEVVVFGPSLEPASQMIWNVYRSMKNKPAPTLGVPHDHILENYPVYFFKVHKLRYEGFLRAARGFHGSDDFPCIQIVWPDANRYFPWDQRCKPSIRDMQPDMSELGWEAELVR